MIRYKGSDWAKGTEAEAGLHHDTRDSRITATTNSQIDDNFFDVIICTNSFHHYLNPHLALNEMYRLLRKGGKAYTLDPTADSWYLKVIDRITKLVEAERVKWYSTEEFRRLYENAGLRYITTKPIKWNSKVHIGEK